MRYPFDTKNARIQTDVPGINGTRLFDVWLNISDTDAVAKSATGVLEEEGLETYDIEVTEDITSPAYPRVLQVVSSNGSVAGSSYKTTIHGTNIADEVIEEEFEMDGQTPVVGDKAFKTVTQIDLPEQAAPGDTISVGWEDKLGLPYKLSLNTVLAAYHNGTIESTPPTVTVDDDIEENTIELDTTLDGNDVDIILLV